LGGFFDNRLGLLVGCMVAKPSALGGKIAGKLFAFASTWGRVSSTTCCGCKSSGREQGSYFIKRK
jgi:hypothetical protein